MNENFPTETRPSEAGLAQAHLIEAGAIHAGVNDGLARRGERELGRLRGPGGDGAIAIAPHGGADASLGGGLSHDERALLLAAFGIDAHTRPLSLLAVDFIRTRRRLRDARPRTADAAC